jgi:TetR/AcrR family transcriptional regulator, transcriptional repressor for nem operon
MGRTSETKENLIDSAIELIGTRSYNAVGVQELCEHAGVKKGSFYHFFPSKRDLTLEALDMIWAKFKEETLDPVLHSDASALEKFRTLLARSYEYQSSRKDCVGCMTGCGFGNLALELSTQDEDIRKKIEEIFCEWTKYLEGVIMQAVDEGVMPPETDPASTSQAVVAYIEGVFLLAKTFNDPCMINRLGEGVLQLCISRKNTANACTEG